MKYAGFWPRLGASIVDFLVVVPVIWFSYWSMSFSNKTNLLLEWPLAFYFDIYTIYFVGRWGQTLGKMAFRIEVVRLDGSNAGMLRAFYRHSVDLVFSILISGLTFYALLSVSSTQYNALSIDGKIELLDGITGNWDKVLNHLSLLWAASELIVLLTNEKKRALHDYIAGTVVIHKQNSGQSHNATGGN